MSTRPTLDARPPALGPAGARCFLSSPHLGLIAEQLPELYHADGDFAGIKATQLPFHLLEIIKAQQARLEALEEKIKPLDERGTEPKDDR